MELFKIDPGLVLWTWIVFGITLFILSKFVFPNILKAIKDRENKIALAVDNASEIEERLADIDSKQSEVIKSARLQANDILRKARSHSENLRKDIIKKAEEEAQEILEQVKVKIDEERIAAIQSIKHDITDLACDMSEKVVERSFISEDDRAWVDEMVKAL